MLLQGEPSKRIKRAERFVQQQYLGPGNERPRDRNTLRHSARKLPWPSFRGVGQPDPVEPTPEKRTLLGPGQTADPERHIVTHPEPGHQPRLLKDEPELRAG